MSKLKICNQNPECTKVSINNNETLTEKDIKERQLNYIIITGVIT